MVILVRVRLDLEAALVLRFAHLIARNAARHQLAPCVATVSIFKMAFVCQAVVQVRLRALIRRPSPQQVVNVDFGLECQRKMITSSMRRSTIQIFANSLGS